MKLTQAAINKALEKRDDETQGLRVSVKGGGCSGFIYSLEFAEPTANDMVEDHGLLKVILDPVSAIYLQDVKLDYAEGLLTSGFTFTDPSSTGTCGCGASFAR